MKLMHTLKQDTLSLSFEVFPPKQDAAFDSVKKATEEIAKLRPAFISVTYGAGGGTSKYTLDIAKNIKDQYNVQTLAHLTCVSSTRETVHQKIKEIKAAGIENIMALRGDIPADMDLSHQETWAYHHAIDLIRELKESGADFCIGGACYPEGHTESLDTVTDLRNLKRKVDAGANQLVTQLFLDNRYFYEFREKAELVGIHVPIEAGIMPVTNKKQIERMVQLCGVHLPEKFMKVMNRYEHQPEALQDAGIAYAIDQIVDLITQGVDGIHLYTMNKPYVARRIYEAVHRLLYA